jgi:hypothetical protein
MERITGPGVDLFADELPSLEEIKKLSEFMHCSETSRISFAEQVEANINKRFGDWADTMKQSKACRKALSMGLTR